ncbi:MAG: hypothetical protein KDB61_16915 [Planctomycetes bacterium]|nr:hypothetical protein [Planctomycetota bacterium]
MTWGTAQVFGRYNTTGALNSLGQFDNSGTFISLGNTPLGGTGYDVPSEIPVPSLPLIQSGETWNFQLWHRETGGSSNFSNGLSVTF